MISYNVFNDLVLQSIGGLDPKFDELIQTISYNDDTCELTATHNGELVDVLTSNPNFVSRASNPRIWEDTFTFTVSKDWQIILKSFVSQKQIVKLDSITDSRAKDYGDMLNAVYANA